MDHQVKIRATMLLLVLLPMAGAGQPPQQDPAFVIDDSGGKVANPMPAKDLERFKQGKQPRIVQSIFTESSTFRPGYVGYFIEHGDEIADRYAWINTRARLSLKSSIDSEISLAASVGIQCALGMRVVRDGEGGVIQATTLPDVFFFSEAKSKVTVVRYLARDCSPNREGLMVPLPGAKWQYKQELWEDLGARTPQSRVIHCRQQYADGAPDQTSVTTHSESEGRLESLNETYRGDPKDPGNIIQRSLLQRVKWPDGPGYRQIRKMEYLDRPRGGPRVVRHTVECWKVDDSGVRTMVKTEDLLNPGDPEETF